MNKHHVYTVDSFHPKLGCSRIIAVIRLAISLNSRAHPWKVVDRARWLLDKKPFLHDLITPDRYSHTLAGMFLPIGNFIEVYVKSTLTQ